MRNLIFGSGFGSKFYGFWTLPNTLNQSGATKSANINTNSTLVLFGGGGQNPILAV